MNTIPKIQSRLKLTDSPLYCRWGECSVPLIERELDGGLWPLIS